MPNDQMAPSQMVLDAPRVGVSVFLATASGIVMLRRRGSRAAGTWSIPGGAQDPGETVDEAAHREILEELGVTIERLTFLPGYSDDTFAERREHWVTLFFAGIANGTPRIMEPHKADALITVVSMDDLPGPLFPHLREKFEQFRHLLQPYGFLG